MQRAFRPLATVSIVCLLLVSGSGRAGPVHEAPTLERTNGADDAPALSPLSSAPLGQAPPAAPVASGAESATAVAAEIMSEAGASMDASAQGGQAKLRAQSQTGAAKPTGEGIAEDDLKLREVGKIALLWAKQTFPWLRGDDEEDDGHDGLMQPADWSQRRDGFHRMDRIDPSLSTVTSSTAGTSSSTQRSNSGFGSGRASARMMVETEPSFVRLAVDFVRMVIDHPMTWLVVSLVIIGGVVAKKIDRRPTK